jgi:hypothetical protein
MDHWDDCGTTPGEALAHEIREMQIIGVTSGKLLLTVAGFFLLPNGNISDSSFRRTLTKPQTCGVTATMRTWTTSSDNARLLRVSRVSFWTYWYLSTCILYLSGCAFFPEKMAEEATQNSCRISTPEWKLTFAEINDVTVCQGSGKDAAYCLLAIGLVIPAGSFVVSGSIVVVGNTLHWLEYQGRCKDSFLRQQLALFKKTFDHNNAD